ncbi:MAG: hypothetical protein JWM31_1864, partial [Solirubrobacterales bacterium]|nr:hypothetical protein [Solirubrobacterales bacterium]
GNPTARRLKHTTRKSGSDVHGIKKGNTTAQATVTVRLTAKARTALGRARRGTSVVLVLELQAADAGGRRVVRDYRLVVKA